MTTTRTLKVSPSMGAQMHKLADAQGHGYEGRSYDRLNWNGRLLRAAVKRGLITTETRDDREVYVLTVDGWLWVAGTRDDDTCPACEGDPGDDGCTACFDTGEEAYGEAERLRAALRAARPAGRFERDLLDLIADGRDDLDALEYVRDAARSAGHEWLAKDLTEYIEIPYVDLDVLDLILGYVRSHGI